MILLPILRSLAAALAGGGGGLVVGTVAGYALTGWLGVPDAEGERVLISGLLFGLPLLIAGFDLGHRLSLPRKRILLALRIRRLRHAARALRGPAAARAAG